MKKQNNSEINKIKPKILKVLKKHNIARAGIFGSYARGEQTKKSDVDILIDINKNISLLGFITIKLALEDALKKRVDLVEYDLIKPIIKDRILKEEIQII